MLLTGTEEAVHRGAGMGAVHPLALDAELELREVGLFAHDADGTQNWETSTSLMPTLASFSRVAVVMVISIV